jgi:hypothetical protein
MGANASGTGSRANASKFLPLLKKHFSQKPQKISECFVRLTREYTDGGTNIRSKPF